MQREVSLEERYMTQILETTALSARLIVEFTKRLPGFHILAQHDQIAVLKVSICG